MPRRFRFTAWRCHRVRQSGLISYVRPKFAMALRTVALDLRGMDSRQACSVGGKALAN